MKTLLQPVFQAIKVKWLLLIFFATIAGQANASHFRYGNITWRSVGTVAQPNLIEFRVTTAWRIGFPWPGSPAIVVGATISSGAANNIIIRNAANNSSLASIPMNIVVNSINVAENYWEGSFVFTYNFPAGNFNYLVFFENCCKLSPPTPTVPGLSNNADGTFRVETIVTIRTPANSAPVASLPAVINVPYNSVATYPVPAVDPDGDAITLTLALPATFGGGTQPSGLSVSGMNLVLDNRISLYPTRTIGSLWNGIINITDSKGARIALDVVFKIVGPSTPPIFNYPPTPANSSAINSQPLIPISFSISARDNDAGDIVTLNATGIPSGASFSSANGNPASTTFSWTPTAAQVGTYVLNFSARDVAGVTTNTIVTIRVSVDPEFIAPTLGDGSILCALPGDPITTIFSARDIDPLNRVSLSAQSGVLPGMVFSPVLPTVNANPSTTNFSWTPTAAQWGVRTLEMKATNIPGFFRTTAVTWIVNNPPVITSTPAVTTITTGQPFSYILTATDANSAEGDNVSIEAAVLPPFLSIVDNGNNTFTISGTPTAADAGTYNVDIELQDEMNHINGTHCGNVHQTFVLTVNPCNLGVTLTPTSPACAGGSDGSVLSNATGVNGTAVYNWSNGASSPNLTNVAEGPYRLTVTDDFGCTATANTTLTAPVDVTPPTFVNPAVITTPTNGSGQVTATSILGAVVNYQAPTATDNCNPGAVTIQCVPASGSVFTIGTTTVVCTATDAAGLTTNSTFNIEVIGAAPVIVCPANISVNNALGQCGANVGFAATETAAIPASTITYSHAPGSFFPVGTTTVTATATNAVSASSCSFTVVVTDNEIPVITTNGNKAVNNDAGVCGATVAVSASATDNCTVGTPSGVRSDGLALGAAYPVGTTTITWNVTDINGNAAVAVLQTVVVTDNEIPVITTNGNKAVNNDAGVCGATVAVSASATDNCTVGTPSGVRSDGLALGAAYPVGTTTITWNVTDINGNAAVAVLQTVVVTDNERPVIIGVPADAIVSCDNITGPGTVSVTDNCSSTLNLYTTPAVKTKLLHHWKADGNFADAVGGATGTPGGAVGFAPGILGSNSFSFNGTSSVITTGTAGSVSGTGNFAVSAWVKTTSTSSMMVIGQRGPGAFDGEYLLKIGGNHFNGVLRPGKVYFLAYGSGSPVVDLFSATSVNDGKWHQIAAEKDGSNIKIYIDGVLDASGSTVVNVSFNPVIVTSIGKDVRDNNSYFNGLIDDIKVWSTTTCPSNYEFDRVWTATDASGNQAAAVQHVTVQDIVAPVLTCPANITVNNTTGQCGANVTFAATAVDNCSTFIISYDKAPGSFFNVGTTTVNVKAKDACGNESTCSFTVTVADTEDPIITCPSSISVNNDANKCGASVAITAATATDNCPGVTVAGIRSDAAALTDDYPVGTTTITWTATDAHGHSVTCNQTVVVTDNKIPVITTNGNKSVNNDAGVCGAAVTVSATAADNCSVGAPSGVRSDGLALNATYPVGTTTITWNVTDVNGNAAVAVVQTVVVTDNEKPVLTCPGIQKFCSVSAGTYTIPVLTASDNCVIQTVSYSITGATTRSGTGYNASGAFAIGTNTITWTVTDINGNVNTCTTTVVIWPLPVASISASNADAFCNKLTLTGSSTLSGPFSFAWKYGATPFANTQSIQLGNTNGDGTYSVWATDGNGCTSASAATFVYLKQNYISNYTILGLKKVEVGEYNVVHGSVGNMDTKYKTEIKKYATVSDPGSFVKGVDLDIDATAIVPNRIYAPAVVTLPTMQYNTSSTSGLPNYTVPQNTTITLNGNYKDINIKKGSNVTLNGTIFGKIDIEEGSYVKFTSPVVNISDMRVGKGPNNGYTRVAFAGNTSVRVSKRVDVEEDCIINPDGYNVTFYMGDNEKDKEKFTVKKGRNTSITANIYIPIGKLEIKKATATESCTMTGTFIAEDIDGDSKYVTWNGYDCNVTAAPIASFAGNTEQQSLAVALTPADGLKVTALPNPTLYQWTLQLRSNLETPVSIRLLNGQGQVVYGKSKVNPNSTISFGGNLRSGVYMAEVIQGKTRQMIRLVKGN